MTVYLYHLRKDVTMVFAGKRPNNLGISNGKFLVLDFIKEPILLI
ncbi:hypothetical protein [Nostoc sp.]